MKLLHILGALVSLAFVAMGFFRLWTLGLSGGGPMVCAVGCFVGLSISVSLYVFHLRDRIAALERAVRPPKPLEL